MKRWASGAARRHRESFPERRARDRVFVYGINFEYSWNAPHWDSHRYRSEIRPIIGWHLGRLDFIVNPIFDNDYEGLGNLDFAPESRLAWNFSKTFAIAAEEYDDFGPVRQFYGHEAQFHPLFSVMDTQIRRRRARRTATAASALARKPDALARPGRGRDPRADPQIEARYSATARICSRERSLITPCMTGASRSTLWITSICFKRYSACWSASRGKGPLPCA